MTPQSKSLSLLELVFEKRNKSYGAYQIRKLHDRMLLVGLLLAISFFVFAAFAPSIFAHRHRQLPVIKTPPVITVSDPIMVEPPKPKVIPQPQQPTASANIDMKKLLQPLFTRDILNQKDSTMHSQDELSKSTLGNKDHTGDSLALTAVDPGAGKKGKKDPPTEPKKTWDAFQVPVKPVFGRGEEDLVKYIQSHINIPSAIKAIGVDETMYVQFVVDETGTVTDATMVRGIDKQLDQEALRVISTMPKWSPGIQNQTPVAVKMVIPIKFEIN